MPDAIQVFIGIGSNLGNPRQQVADATKALAQITQTRVVAFSPWYESDPVGPAGQPNYINGAAWLETTLDAHTLLDSLQAIENAHQRVREVRWGPRTLDLDILLYGNAQIDTDRLHVPHPYLTERSFVIQPLADLKPDIVLPGGMTLTALLRNTDTSSLRRLTSPLIEPT